MNKRCIIPLFALALALMLFPVALAGSVSQVTLKFVKDGQPLADILVEVYDSNNTVIYKGFTDSQGQVILYNVTEGNYTVKAYLKNEFLNSLVEYKFEVEITASQTTYEFDLSLGQSWKNINWRPLLIVAGLGILGFLILFGIGASVGRRVRL